MDGAFAFAYGHDPINAGDRDFLSHPIRPVDLNFIHFCGGSETEMDTWIGAGTVTPATKNIGPLPNTPGSEQDFRADGVARTLRTAD